MQTASKCNFLVLNVTAGTAPYKTQQMLYFQDFGKHPSQIEQWALYFIRQLSLSGFRYGICWVNQTMFQYFTDIRFHPIRLLHLLPHVQREHLLVVSSSAHACFFLPKQSIFITSYRHVTKHFCSLIFQMLPHVTNIFLKDIMQTFDKIVGNMR